MWFLSRLVVSLTVRGKNSVDGWSHFMWTERSIALIIRSKRQNLLVIRLLNGTFGSTASPRCETQALLKQQLAFDLLSYCWLWQNWQYTHYGLWLYSFRTLESNFMVSCGFERESPFLTSQKRSWSYFNSCQSFQLHLVRDRSSPPEKAARWMLIETWPRIDPIRFLMKKRIQDVFSHFSWGFSTFFVNFSRNKSLMKTKANIFRSIYEWVQTETVGPWAEVCTLMSATAVSNVSMPTY